MSGPAPAQPADTDRNLLFGVLALQADLIDNNQFAEVCGAWAARKDKPLADLLVERGRLSPADRHYLDGLLERKVKKHGGDVRKSLGAVADGAVRDIIREATRALFRRRRACGWRRARTLPSAGR
jgi:hypothetical protein